MEKNVATTIFESLSSGVRLDVFRLLVRQGVQGMVAGEIAATLQIAPTNLSFHLKALTQAGLIQVTPEGRFQRYRAHLVLMRALIAYLTEECCLGRPEQCLEVSQMQASTLVPCCDSDSSVPPSKDVESEIKVESR